MDAQQINKNNISITSISPELVANETENTFIKRDRNIHRFKGHLPISSTSSVQLFEAQRNIQDMAPLSPSVPYRLTKTLPGILFLYIIQTISKISKTYSLLCL
jgi:hypothetical protein